MDDPADLVLVNGRVFMGLREGIAEALALTGGRVSAVGPARDVARSIGPDTCVIDLAGRLATPGLFDAHLHLLPHGLGLGHLDLKPAQAPTLDALLRLVGDAAARQAPGRWIVGRGYDHRQLDVRRHPLREELDAVAPDHPVYLVRACGHLAVANSRALALAGLDECSALTRAVGVETRDGRATGVLFDKGRELLKAVLPAASDADLDTAIAEAGRRCLAHGITSVMDAAVGHRAGLREVEAYRRAEETGRLPVRVTMACTGGPGGIADAMIEKGFRTGAGSARLRHGPVKLFADGTAGGRTAAMTLAYRDGGYGTLAFTDDMLAAMVRRYHEAGCQVAIHAIGDAAIDQALDAIEGALAAAPAAGRRHRIEHASFARPDQGERMARLGVEPVPQAVFLYEFGETYVDAIGRERTAISHPQRSWMRMGLRPPASTDTPVADLSPFANLHALTTRRSRAGTDLSGDERVSMAEALAAYTEFSAHANHCETWIGRLLPGFAADVAIFSRDLLTAGERDLLENTVCDMTILAGTIVHDRHGATA